MSEGELFDLSPDSAGSEAKRRESPPGGMFPENPPPPPHAGAPEEAPPLEKTRPAQRTAPPPHAGEPEETPPPKRTRPAPRTAPPSHSGTLGETLAALRRRSNLELDEVADITRIKRDYLEALENGEFSSLPQLVYVLAYVKKLCEVYGVDPEGTEELVSGLREQLSYEIPEDIDKSVVCREQDEETRRKLRHITVALVAGTALAALLLILGVMVLLVNLRSAGTVEEPSAGGVDETRVLSLQGRPELQTSVITE